MKLSSVTTTLCSLFCLSTALVHAPRDNNITDPLLPILLSLSAYNPVETHASKPFHAKSFGNAHTRPSHVKRVDTARPSVSPEQATCRGNGLMAKIAAQEGPPTLYPDYSAVAAAGYGIYPDSNMAPPPNLGELCLGVVLLPHFPISPSGFPLSAAPTPTQPTCPPTH